MKLRTFFALIAVAAIVFFTVQRGRIAMGASLPKDMPQGSRFLQTGYDTANSEAKGQWVACRPDVDEPSDWCRVTNQSGIVLYEGEFLPVDSTRPVGKTQLVVGTLQEDRLWTAGPTEQAQVPVIPLEDGQLLVPEADRSALITRWAEDPEESQKYRQAEPAIAN